MNTISRVSRLAVSARTLARPLSTSTARFANDKNPLDANKGSIGKEFQPDGKIGSKAQEVGGPFDKDGTIGKQFKKEGAIGSTGQDVAEQAQGDKKSMFDADGAVGKQFESDGAIGGTAQAVGGPFAADGAIGKQFTKDGAIGGTVQENLGDDKNKK